MKILTNKKSYQLKAIIKEKGEICSYYLMSGQSMTTSGQIEYADDGIKIEDKPKRINKKSKLNEIDSQQENQTMEKK